MHAEPTYRETRGAIVALEGLSSVGKSHAVELLRSSLRGQGRAVRVVEWNSVPAIRSVIAWLLRAGLLGVTAYSLLSWVSCLICFVREIAPALRRGDLVIADRYLHTGLTRDRVNGAPRWLSSTFASFLPRPELVIFFAVSPEVACHGIARRGGKALFHRCRTIPAQLVGLERDVYYMRELYRTYLGLFARGEGLRPGSLVSVGSEHTGLSIEHPALPKGLLQRVDDDVRSYVEMLSRELVEQPLVAAVRARRSFEGRHLRIPRAPSSGPQQFGKAKQMYDKIGAVLRRYTQAAPSQLEACTKLRDLGITSVNVVNIIADLEEEFGVVLDMGSINRESFESVETIAALVNAASGAVSAAV